MADFVSDFKPLYDELVSHEITVADAVGKATAFQEEKERVVPRVYFSTAITSGGFYRDKNLSLPEVIARNGKAAQLIVSGLAENKALSVSPKSVMLPTELGKVPGWVDSHYILFYFCWLSGLSSSGTAWVESELEDPVYRPILAMANDRSNSNEERWPSDGSHYTLVFYPVLGSVISRGPESHALASWNLNLALRLLVWELPPHSPCGIRPALRTARALRHVSPERLRLAR